MKLPRLSVLQTSRKMKQWLDRMTGKWPLLLIVSHRSYSRTVHLQNMLYITLLAPEIGGVSWFLENL